MKKKRQIIQFSLVFIGLILILSTYFLYPELKKKSSEVKIIEDKEIQTDDEQTNRFENVEYKGFYDINKPFTVKSEKAYILKKDSNVVYMTNMLVTLYMDDGRIIIITSKKGSYNKVTYDCYFKDDVKATDNDTTISAQNLDLLASEDFAKIYNEVFLINNNGSLKADKVE